MSVTVATKRKREVIDMTDQVESLLPKDKNGIVVVNVLHTTAAITTADLDPGTDLDLLDALDNLIPELPWRHPHDPQHAPDHLLASIIGPSVTLSVHHGSLSLGAWQRIILVEFDGPRRRDVEVTFLPV